MKSKTLCFETGGWFNAGLFRKNLTRFWPLWTTYTVAWLVMLPLTQFLELFGLSARYVAPAELAARAAGNLLNIGVGAGLVMAVLFGCLFAVALFSYLCTARSVGMMHAFPIRREGLFFTNYASGAAVFLGAQLLTFLLTAAVQGAAGVLIWGNLFRCFAYTAGTMLFFYSFAVFCAMFTGQVLAIPVFYAVLNVLAGGLNLLVQTLASSFFYGYDGGGTPDWIRWLTPVWKMESSVDVRSDWDEVVCYSYNYRLEGLSVVAVYAAVAVVLTVAALLVYRRRRSETAGDTVTVLWAQKLFRFGVGVCFALSLGQGLYFLFWEQFTSRARNSMTAMLACMILLGLVGYFAAEMLLKKSFRVLKSGWKGAAVLTAILIVFGVCIRMDVTGVETRVPSADRVESLSFDINGEGYCDGETSDPALMERFREVHQALIAEKEVQLDRHQESWYDETSSYQYGSLNLTYHMKNGASISRNYSLCYQAQDLAEESSALAQLAALSCTPEVQRSSLRLGEQSDMDRITGGDIEKYTVRNSEQDYLESEYRTLDQAAAERLYEALCRDVEAGHFGMNQFDPDGWNRETYINNITIYYSLKNHPEDGFGSFDLRFSTNCTEILQALEELGLTEEIHLMTFREREEWENKEYPTDFTDFPEESSSGGIIGGADGPTEIYVA